MKEFSVCGLLTDIFNQRIYPACITVKDTKIFSIEEIKETDLTSTKYIIPGFIDSHVHIESSMLVPAEFARIAVTHGTVPPLVIP